MNAIILLFPLLLLIVVITPAVVHATNDMMPDGKKLSWDWHLLPDSSHSIQWDDGYKAGYMGVHPMAEHTRDFWAGYRSGTEQVVSDKEFCKDVLMRDHQSCTNISHYSGPLNAVATSGPVECHEKSGNQVCEAGIGQNNNTR